MENTQDIQLPAPEAAAPQPAPAKTAAKSINLGASREAELFVDMFRQSGARSERIFVGQLLEAYASASQPGSDSRLADLLAENAACQATLANLEAETEELRRQLDEARSAVSLRAWRPAALHFLRKQAEKAGTAPELWLETFFLRELLNPTVNNLEFTPTAAEIRRASAPAQDK